MGFRFAPPAFLDDFDDAGRLRWHQHMSAEAERNLAELISQLQEADPDATARDVFYVNPVEEPAPADAQIATAEWGGFPQALLARTRRDRHEARRRAEELGMTDFAPGTRFVTAHREELSLPARHLQDEYLEWRTERDHEGVVTRVTFTCEGYDYWSKLFAHSPSTVVKLYKRLLDRDEIEEGDLRFDEDVFIEEAGREPALFAKKGQYNPRNRFNVDEGLVHLTHRANSLGAEVNLAVVASALRQTAGREPVDGADKRRLTCCGGFGNANRDSDPTIGAAANGLAAAGRAYTLTNPVGLYISEYPRDEVFLPNHTRAPRAWWRVERGAEATRNGHARILRLVFAVPQGQSGPDGKPLRVGDLEIDDAPIEHGAQLAEFIRLHLMVSWWEAGDRRQIRLPCASTCCLDETNRELLVSRPGGDCVQGLDPFPELAERSDRSPVSDLDRFRLGPVAPQAE
jgi:hypothetical protein